jgi:hypothetical protein
MDEGEGASFGLFESLLFDFKLARHRIWIWFVTAHTRTWLRHFMWPLMRLRIQLFLLDFKFNRGWPVDEFHRWLGINLDASPYLSVDEVNQYFVHLGRLRERAHAQDFRKDVRYYLRAPYGWLWFHKPAAGSNVTAFGCSLRQK